MLSAVLPEVPVGVLSPLVCELMPCLELRSDNVFRERGSRGCKASIEGEEVEEKVVPPRSEKIL